MKSVIFKESEYLSKSAIINDALLDNDTFDELERKKIIVKSEKSDGIYYFDYVGVAFTSKSMLYVIPKVLNKEEAFIKPMIKLLFEYSKREKLLDQEKEFLGIDTTNDKGSLLSIINYILEDYEENGLYMKKRKIREINGNGEIDWIKTVDKNDMLINDDVPVYYELVTVKNNIHKELIITKIHKEIINICIRIVEKLNLNDIFNFTSEEFEFDDSEFMDYDFILEQLEKELDIQYEDKKIELLEVLISFIKKTECQDNEVELTLFGTKYFNIIWEKMNGFIFRNEYDELKEHIPKPKWHDEISKKSEERKTIIPDILYKDSSIKRFYILDAKYFTTDFKEGKLLGTVQGMEEITKQLVYEDILRQKFKDYAFVNAFIIPTKKEASKFGHVNFPISNTGKEIQLVHMNLIQVVEMYLRFKKINLDEWYNSLDLKAYVKCSDEIIEHKILETIYSKGIEETKKDYVTERPEAINYSERTMDIYNITIKLLKKKFGDNLTEEYDLKIKRMALEKVNRILENIFELTDISEIENYK